MMRGKTVLTKAKQVLPQLQTLRIPFIFLTNGGGILEEERAESLSKFLGTEIQPSQIVLSHSPMKQLVKKYHNARVLVIGFYDSLKVAKHYGFTKAISPREFAQENPHLYPFLTLEHKCTPFFNEPISAIMIFHDSTDWALEIQLCCDILRGGKPLGHGRRQCVPLYASNPDLVYPAEHGVPRFAQGAFVHALEHLFT